MKILFGTFLCFLLCLGCAVQRDPAAKAGAAAQAKQAKVIDVRTKAEYAGGHVRGSTNVPLSELSARISEVAPDKQTPIMVHCQGGSRSARAKATLEKLGYTNVTDLGSLENARAKIEGK